MITLENQSGVCKWTKTKKSNFGTTKSSGKFLTNFKVKKDVKRAKQLFRESAELGNEAAKEYLASLEE